MNVNTQRSMSQKVRYAIGNIVLGLFRVALLVALFVFDIRAVVEDVDVGLFKVTFDLIRGLLVSSGLSQELGYAIAVGLALPLYLTGIVGLLGLVPKLLRLLGLLPPEDVQSEAVPKPLPSPWDAMTSGSPSKLVKLSTTDGDALKKIYGKANARGQLVVLLILSAGAGILVYYGARGQEFTNIQPAVVIPGVLYGILFAYWRTAAFSAKQALSRSHPVWLHSHNHVQWMANFAGAMTGLMIAGAVGGVLASVAISTGHRDLVYNNAVGLTSLGGLVILVLVIGWLISTWAYKASERKILRRNSPGGNVMAPGANVDSASDHPRQSSGTRGEER